MSDTCVVWHGHHEAEFPIEVLPESYESRLKTIETIKSLEETPQKIAWRKKLFKGVIGPLPASVQDAVDKLSKSGAAWDRARAECDKAWDEFDKARDEYVKARAEYDKAWDEFDKAWAEYRKAEAELDKARAAWNKAWDEYDKAFRDNLSEMMELHSKECGCAWTPNNRNIFSYMPEEEND